MIVLIPHFLMALAAALLLGGPVIAALKRLKARQVISAERCVSVWLNAPVEVCRQRDKSGAYAMADAGRIAQFPGVSAAFEPPGNADLVLPTHEVDVGECVERIVGLLRDRGFVAR